MCEIVNLKSQKPGVVDKIDDFDKDAIRRKVHSFWLNREIPTLPKILIAMNEDKTIPTIKVTFLRIVLKSLKFKFTKRKRNSILTKRRDLVGWRKRKTYLLFGKKMDKYRQGIACPESKCTKALTAIGNNFLLCWLHCRIALLLTFKTKPERVQ